MCVVITQINDDVPRSSQTQTVQQRMKFYPLKGFSCCIVEKVYRVSFDFYVALFSILLQALYGARYGLHFNFFKQFLPYCPVFLFELAFVCIYNDRISTIIRTNAR